MSKMKSEEVINGRSGAVDEMSFSYEKFWQKSSIMIILTDIKYFKNF